MQSLSLRNPTQVIRAGDTIATIFPDTAELKVQALVPAKEISQLDIGQSANLRISACPFSQFGTLPGTVSAISPDTIPSNPKDSTPTAKAFYSVTIQPQQPALSAGEKDCIIQSGIEGRADIITRRETVLDFILRKVNLLTTLNTYAGLPIATPWCG